ncbi:ribonuclease H-like domain-containing protein [Tanacetum coccineum]
MAIGETSAMLINNLDAGNPLHMHPNDSTSTTLISFKLQGTENYRIWSNAMKLALRARNKYAFVDGSCVKSDYVTSDVLEFDALTKLPTCTCDANKELGLHNQLMKLMQFLMGLNDCYEFVISALLTMDPLPEIKDVYITVSREESHRGIPKSFNVTESKINATSFAAKGCYELIGYHPGFKKVGNPIKQSGFKKIFNSNSDVKSNKKQQSSASQSSYSSFNPEQMRKLLCLINDTLGTVHATMLVDISTLKIIVGRPNGTLATDLKKEITLGTGSESVGLYLFDMEPDNNIGKVNMVVSCHVFKDLWHNRLGHPAHQVLNVLKTDLFD